jgi:hypothetical protein
MTQETTMNAVPQPPTPAHSHRLCFAALGTGGRTFDFPCDSDGHVDLDRLSERSRNDYFFARAVVRTAFARPSVRRAD